MRTQRGRRLVARLGGILLFAVACAPKPAEPARPKLLFTSDTACRLSLDGEQLGELVAHGTLEREVEPGEHLVRAVAADGRQFSQVVTPEGARKVVTVRFEEKKASSSRPKPATTAETPPPPKRASSERAQPARTEPTGTEPRPVDAPAAVAEPGAAMVVSVGGEVFTSGQRYYRMVVHSAAIARNASNGDPNATFSGDVPPDAYFDVYVDGSNVHSSRVVMNSFEPGWFEGFNFFGSATSPIRIVVYEADFLGDVRQLAAWSSTVGQLVKAGGRLRFGVVESLSFALE